MVYLFSFCVLPLLFFTFARNIIFPYVFPVLPAFALIMTTLVLSFDFDAWMQRYFYWSASLLAIFSLVATLMLHLYPIHFSKSTDQMIEAWRQDYHATQQPLIYLHQKPEYSSMFYSQGKVIATRDKATLCAWLKQGLQYVVLDSDQPCDYQTSLAQTSQVITQIQHRSRIDTLFKVNHIPDFCG